MSEALQNKIRLRAYQIWEEEGRPAGRHLTHWHRAERELAADERSVPDELSAVEPSDLEETEGVTQALQPVETPPALHTTRKDQKP